MLRLLPLLLLTACLTAVPQRVEVVLQPDEERDGTGGTDGPLAVAKVRLDVQARVVDSFLIHVFFAWNLGDPATASDDTLYPSTLPLIVLLQERGVSVERYFWLARHFASRGYPTVVVDHFADAPLIESDNGVLALENVRRVSRFNGPMKELVPEVAKGLIMGHGEGGRAAQDLWVRYPADFERLLVLGTELDPAAMREGGQAACIGGVNDKRTAGMIDVCKTFPATDVADVDGVVTPVCVGDVCRSFSSVTNASFVGINHYLFADDLLAVESQGDGPLGDKEGPAPDSVEGLRLNALTFIDAWLDASLRGDSAAQQSIAACQALSVCQLTEGCTPSGECTFRGAAVMP